MILTSKLEFDRLSQRAKFLRFLAARVGEAAAEDILQSAYIRAVEKRYQIQDSESAVAWFYRLLRNAITNHYRRAAARDRAHEQFVSEAPINYEHELEGSVCQCVGDVMQSLKDDYPVASERVDLAGDSIGDFAISQGTTPNNASVRLHRARKAAAKNSPRSAEPARNTSVWIAPANARCKKSPTGASS